MTPVFVIDKSGMAALELLSKSAVNPSGFWGYLGDTITEFVTPVKVPIKQQFIFSAGKQPTINYTARGQQWVF